MTSVVRRIGYEHVRISNRIQWFGPTTPTLTLYYSPVFPPLWSISLRKKEMGRGGFLPSERRQSKHWCPIPPSRYGLENIVIHDQTDRFRCGAQTFLHPAVNFFVHRRSFP